MRNAAAEPTDTPEGRVVVQPVHQGLNVADVQVEAGQEGIDYGQPVVGRPAMSWLTAKRSQEGTDLNAGEDSSQSGVVVVLRLGRTWYNTKVAAGSLRDVRVR